MTRYGFSIHNQGKQSIEFHYGGRRTWIRAGASLHKVFPQATDAADALDKLHRVVVQLAASVCAQTFNGNFEIIPEEFGYSLHTGRDDVFDVRLIDPEPTKIELASGLALST